MSIANINGFIRHLQGALDALGCPPDLEQVERMAVLVHSAMESPNRRYHNSDHALSLCEGMAPRQVLAAVFHDVVYYQLDRGFAPRLSALLTPLVSQQGQELVLLKPDPQDLPLQLCQAVFGFAPGQVLPLFLGMNEFLSAALALRLLQPLLPPADLLAVAACIEATVPFRAPLPDGRDCSMVLAGRVRALAQQHLGLASGAALDAYVERVMHEAVGLANRDVGGFAEPDPGRFVSGTWLLIEESNAPLAAVGVYTLQEYREALMRMEVFLGSLQAARVFQQYAAQPAPEESARLRAAAAANIRFALDFLRLKICSTAVIEALALQTGGNGPVSMFLGDIRSRHGRPERIEDHLPSGPARADLDPELLVLLEKGRPEESRHDLTISPLTAYLYRCLGPAGCADVLERARRMATGQLAPADFLAALPAPLLASIIDACARIALSRRHRLLALRPGAPPPQPSP